MGKPQSREPAEAMSSEVGTPSREDSASTKKPARRPARRSIVDLTEAARLAADEGVLPTPTAAAPDDPPRRRRAASPAAIGAGAPDQAAVRSVASDAPAARAGNGKGAGAPATCELGASDSSADMAVKIAKACQAETLDDIKAGFNAALDYAAEFARRGASSEAAKDYVKDHAKDHAKDHVKDQTRDHGPAASGAETRNALAAQYRAEAGRLMKANMATSMDFARRLLGAKSTAEWVELTSSHARLQCELMLQQAQALRSLARGMTDSGAGSAAPPGSTSQK